METGSGITRKGIPGDAVAVVTLAFLKMKQETTTVSAGLPKILNPDQALEKHLILHQDDSRYLQYTL